MAHEDPIFYKWGGGVDPDYPNIVSAHDEYLETEDGEQIVDAAAGAAVANLGHSVEGIGDVMKTQAEKVGYLSLSHFQNNEPSAVARKLASITPDGLEWTFFNTSGSEAVETAIKFARFYHRERGNPERTAVISRWNSYHGATLGALSATGNTGRRTPYLPYLHQWPKIPAAYPYRWEYAGSPEDQAITAAGQLEETIRHLGSDQIAAFIAEPVSGSSIPGAHPHPQYYKEIRRICDEYGILFIADEVMTGFGRTGDYFGCDRFDVVPDLMAVGKGLSAGYAPISATVIHDALISDLTADARERFYHGHTFAGHPISSAVARHVLCHYTDDLIDTVRRRGQTLRESLAPIDSHPIVGEIRRAGLMFGIEFVTDKKTKAPFDPDLSVADRIYDAALNRGVYIYPGGGSVDGCAGDHCMLAPPLTVGEESVQTIGKTVVDAVETVAVELPDDSAWNGYRD